MPLRLFVTGRSCRLPSMEWQEGYPENGFPESLKTVMKGNRYGREDQPQENPQFRRTGRIVQSQSGKPDRTCVWRTTRKNGGISCGVS